MVRSATDVITVVGGKLTTYRKMAEDAVDCAVEAGGLNAGPCRTRNVPLVGAASRAVLDKVRAPAGLVARYGTEAEAIAGVGGDGLRQVAGLDICAAELAFAVSHEGRSTRPTSWTVGRGSAWWLPTVNVRCRRRSGHSGRYDPSLWRVTR